MTKKEQEPVVTAGMSWSLGMMVMGIVTFVVGPPAVKPFFEELLQVRVSEGVLSVLEWGMITASVLEIGGGVVSLAGEALGNREIEFEWRVEE